MEYLACVGPEAIAGAIRARCAGEKCVVVFECYPGTDREEIDRITARLSPVLTIDADDCAFAPEKLTAAWQDNLTEDRVFGKMTTAHLEDYFEPERIAACRGLGVQVFPCPSRMTSPCGALCVFSNKTKQKSGPRHAWTAFASTDQ